MHLKGAWGVGPLQPSRKLVRFHSTLGRVPSGPGIVFLSTVWTMYRLALSAHALSRPCLDLCEARPVEGSEAGRANPLGVTCARTSLDRPCGQETSVRRPVGRDLQRPPMAARENGAMGSHTTNSRRCDARVHRRVPADRRYPMTAWSRETGRATGGRARSAAPAMRHASEAALLDIEPCPVAPTTRSPPFLRGGVPSSRHGSRKWARALHLPAPLHRTDGRVLSRPLRCTVPDLTLVRSLKIYLLYILRLSFQLSMPKGVTVTLKQANISQRRSWQ